MKKSMIRISSLISAAIFFAAGSSQACSVCFGDPSFKMSQSLFGAMYFLLGAITLVLGGIAWTAWTWAKRARMLEKQI